MAVSPSEFSEYISTNLQSPKTLKEIKKDFEKAGDDNMEQLIRNFVAQNKLHQKFIQSINSTVFIIGPPATSANASMFNSPFKSPVRASKCSKEQFNNQSTDPNSSSAAQLLNEIDKLKLKLTQTNEAVSLLSQNYSKDELDLHIRKLHEYNEIKDVGQILLGKIAETKGVTTSNLYEQYGLTLND